MSSRFIKRVSVSNASMTTLRMLSGMGVRFEMEQWLPLVKPDFNLYKSRGSNLNKVALFLDGPHHHKQRYEIRDDLIDEILPQFGWHVLRFPYKPSGPDGLSKRDQKRLRERIKEEL